jgi:hypothetical protein
MKKLSFCITAIVMISSSVSFANTIEIKEDKKLTNTNSLVENNEKKDDGALTICYEQSRSTSIHPSGVEVTTTTWMCFNHPEMPGKGTVYISAN